MMKWCLFAAVLTLICCNSNKMSDKNTLLTSTTWEAPSVIDNKQNVEGTLSFAENGTYTETFNQQHSSDELVMIGTWKWINENEISLVFKRHENKWGEA